MQLVIYKYPVCKETRSCRMANSILKVALNAECLVSEHTQMTATCCRDRFLSAVSTQSCPEMLK